MPLLTPSVTTNPIAPPPNAYRATSVEQMFAMHFSAPSLDYVVDVGVQSQQTYTVIIKNKTISHQLMVVFDVPEFLSITEGANIVIEPQQVRELNITMSRAATQVTNVSGVLKFSISPLNVTTSVYVQNS